MAGARVTLDRLGGTVPAPRAAVLSMAGIPSPSGYAPRVDRAADRSTAGTSRSSIGKRAVGDSTGTRFSLVVREASPEIGFPAVRRPSGGDGGGRAEPAFQPKSEVNSSQATLSAH